MMPLPLSLMYNSPLGTRLEVGRTIYARIGARLRKDKDFQQQFQLLTLCAADVNEQMARMDLGSCCCRCAAQPSGGCCSLAIAAETDAIQICMNLLVGIDVRQVNSIDNECVYLGNRGCLFLFKPIFCLNYLCGQITDSSKKEDLRELERLTGRLLTQQYEIERRILQWMQSDSVLIETLREKNERQL